jgi:hypothetical protein
MSDFLSQLVKPRDAKPPYFDDAKHEDSDRPSSSKLKEPDQPAEITNVMRYVVDSGLFDAEFYLASCPDIPAGADPVDHFVHNGFQECRSPNPYFEPLWYLDANPDVRNARLHPLLHYVLVGDKEGRRPSLKFDTAWYRGRNGVGPSG